MYTETEIRNILNTNYDIFDFSEKEIENYVKLITKMQNHKSNFQTKDVFDILDEKLNTLYELFLKQGFSKEKSNLFTKKLGLCSDRKNILDNIYMIRALNIEEKAIVDEVLFFRRTIEEVHAKKCYLRKINDNNQSIRLLLRSNSKDFEKKFNVNFAELIKEYPVTPEVKAVLQYTGLLTNEQLYDEFKLTRQQLADIYPTTKEELAVLKTISQLSDEEIKQRYGINRDNLLKKYPLNIDTLNALKTINNTKDILVERIMQQPKQEILMLRTITTEMIKTANQKYKLQRISFKKEEKSKKL